MPSPITQRGILVGIDGSPSSASALRWAAKDAAMRNVPLHLVHVLPAVVPTWTAATAVPPMPADVSRWREADGRQVIADGVKIVEQTPQAQSHGQPEVTSRLFYSPTIPTLVDLSKEADMLVVGCRGRGAVDRMLLGSVSSGLVHRAHCPVAVIHDDAESSDERAASAPVVVGIDGSPASELATAIAFDEASWRGVRLVALHAVSDADLSFGVASMEWSATMATAEQTLAERLAGWQERYPDVAVRRAVVADRPAGRLLDEAGSAQLVVVGSHGRGGFAGMLLGSVSTAVVSAARTPVIVARQH